MSNINNGGQSVLYLLDQIDFISGETISVNVSCVPSVYMYLSCLKTFLSLFANSNLFDFEIMPV